ncbi:MAG: hypothetical protein NC209_02180 [Alistipes sp.]|nr:hypothetical protein [Alistipes senegalensis]MCM1249937.1 hypothetical protein [Alistipes sp.]
MEDKNLTPQQSMALITAMIQNSKQRVAMPDLHISIMWAVLSIVCAVAVFAAIFATGDVRFNWLWLAIPLLGIPSSIVLARKKRAEKRARTYIDRMSSTLWKVIGFFGAALSLVCLGFSLCGYPQAWTAMFLYAFIVVGFGAAMQGVILQEPAYLFGGVCSILAGFVSVILSLCRIPLLMIWALPLYVLCFLLMFIVPAFVIRRKLDRAAR